MQCKVGDYILIVRDAAMSQQSGTCGNITEIENGEIHMKVIRWGSEENLSDEGVVERLYVAICKIYKISGSAIRVNVIKGNEKCHKDADYFLNYPHEYVIISEDKVMAEMI